MTVMMSDRVDPSGRDRSYDERSDNMMGSDWILLNEGADDCIDDRS